MKQRDRISATFCFFLGLTVLINAIRLNLKVGLEMGPGFFPFLAGGILTLLSFIVLVLSFADKRVSEQREAFWVNKQGRLLVLLTLFVTVLYILTLNYLGFLLSTFLLLLFLFRIIGRQKWWVVGVGSVTTVVLVYLIFEIWLLSNLPRGILSF